MSISRLASPELPYIVPLLVYILGTSLSGSAGDYYPVAYAATVLITGWTAYWSRSRMTCLNIHKQLGFPVLVGVVGIVAWIGLCKLNLEAKVAPMLPSILRPQARTAYDPFAELSTLWAVSFIAIRLVGLAIIVPYIEEIFWRGFLAKWLVAENWEEVPIGKFSVQSFLIVTLAFTVAHPEWVAAAMYCALLNGYLLWKKDLWGCILAHAVSNLLLGIYVLTTGAYELW